MTLSPDLESWRWRCPGDGEVPGSSAPHFVLAFSVCGEGDGRLQLSACILEYTEQHQHALSDFASGKALSLIQRSLHWASANHKAEVSPGQEREHMTKRRKVAQGRLTTMDSLT